jgi:alkylhydroperoxidase/carboxymuconolactone decarboxylase family protein YurZ
MSISESANRNHEKWFPNHKSTLKVTDPEFIELFDNFAFDEVLSHGDLDDRTRLQMILAALIAGQALGEYQQHINRHLSGNCFGDTYTRTGLDVKTRELLTFSMLLALGGCEPQLKGHIQGNLKVGNGRETLMAVVTQLLPFVGYPRTLNAMRCLNEVAPESKP